MKRTEDFFANLGKCKQCKERAFAAKHILAADTGPVPAVGPFDTKICFLGRNPGASEIVQREPFRGRAGNELQKVLEICGLKREECYITNVVKCFTPSGVAPENECKKRCVEQWLLPELEQLTKMEFLVTLGNEALQTVIADAHVSDFHGMTSKMKLNGRFITHFVMFHPAAMLYDSRVRERFWRDAHELAKLLKEERKGS